MAYINGMYKDGIAKLASETTGKTISRVDVRKAYERRYKIYIETMARWEKDPDSLTVHISFGNSKMGPIPSFSVLPLLTCINCGECSKYCYACKSCFNFNDNIVALAENTVLLEKDPERVYNAIMDVLKSGAVLYRFFRFDVAGDVYSLEYLELIEKVCNECEYTSFLVFTKNYVLFNTRYAESEKPKNLAVVFSQWDNMKVDNPLGFPIAIVKIIDTVIPKNAYKCSGDCSSCFNCWNCKQDGSVRYFDLH